LETCAGVAPLEFAFAQTMLLELTVAHLQVLVLPND